MTGIFPVKNGKKVGANAYPANFIFPKREVHKLKDSSTQTIYSRVDCIKKSWAPIKKNAGVNDLQIKDLRTF